MKKAFVILGFFLLSNSFSGEKNPPVKIVENGKPEAVIIISEKPKACVKKAQKELSEYLQKISGAQIQTIKVPETTDKPLNELTGGKNAILLGDSHFVRKAGIDADKLPSEGFIIKSSDNTLIITGNDGDRYNDNYRTCTDSAGTLYGVYRFLENLGVRWFYPCEQGTIIPKQASIEIPSGEIRDKPYNNYRDIGSGDFPWARKVGAGGDCDIWSTHHDVSIELKKKYRDTHPEWFLKNADGELGGQADLNNPEVIDIMVGMARKRFSSDIPEGAKKFLILPLDGGACREANSEDVTSAIEKVANKLKDEFPSYKVVHCPYSNFREAPKRVRNLPENMVLLIALSRAYLFPPNSKDDFYKIISDWQKFHPAAIYFCRYGNSLMKMSPALIPHLISEDIKRLKKMSGTGEAPIRGEMNFGGIKPDSEFAWWEFLNEYTAAKMLWNPDLNVDDLLNDFCEKMFGPGAKEMRAFLEICENSYLDPNQRDFFKVETIIKLENLIEAARAKTVSSEYASRVELFDKGINPLRQLKDKLISSEKSDSPLSSGAPIRYYSFDKINGNTVTDAFGKNEAIIHNAVSVDGVSGKALYFSGDKSFIKIPPLQLQKDYSLEAWIRPEKMERGMQCILGPNAWERQILAVDYFYPAEKGVSGKIILKHRRWENWKNIKLTSGIYDFIPNKWYHVVGTFSKKNGMTIYVNGKIIGIDMFLREPSEMSLHFIGASGKGDKEASQVINCFIGVIDEVKIYERELSYPEVIKEYKKYEKNLNLKNSTL